MLTAPGAVAAGGPDAGVAAHYGEPYAEQRALAAGRAVVDLSHLGVVTVAGVDRLTWLDTLSSAWLRDLAPGVGAELLLLDPHGHVEHAAAVVDDGATTWLVTEADDAAPLAAFLDSMRFTLRVEVAVRDDVAVLGAVGDAARKIASAAQERGALLGVWRDPWPAVVAGGTRYSAESHPGEAFAGAYVLVPWETANEVVDGARQAGELRLAGAWAWEALRVEARRPRFAREVDERSIPHELDWLRTAVHLDKGCYRGQETVARVFNMGRPPRRLVLLHLDGSEDVLPEPGTEVLAEGRPVGTLTSVVRHHELGPIGLAVVKRSLPLETELVVGGVAASQEEVVGTDGIAVGRPAPRESTLPPLRRRVI
nr:glycine cleavage T C-terminal barrel domain-containing protein [Beutenbergia cavernae]